MVGNQDTEALTFSARLRRKVIQPVFGALKFLLRIPAFLGIGAIHLYQITVSPDHSWLRHLFPGGFCRFQPSCSSYTREAILKYGLIVGSLKGFWRILRCNPWSKGGLDLP